jgi:two-component system chemotaxis response regulator CheY
MANPNSALIADDEKHIRSYVRLILNRLGVEEVYEASDGASAVESYRENHPDIVLLDIKMTGLEALPKILEIDPEAIVVMLTGHASRHLIEGSAKAGAVHYIRKDTPQQEISDMLTELFKELYEED